MIDAGLKWATATAPATVSNVAVGFDILGFSLEAPHDRVTVRRSALRGVRIVDADGDSKLPDDPEQNTATAGLVALVEERQPAFGFDVEIDKGVPLHSGMGGSAASAVASIVAASSVLDRPLNLPERFHYAFLGEQRVCGQRRGDNIAPSMLGGLILVRSMEPFEVVRLPVPHDMGAVVVHPHIKVKVREARQLLRREIELDDHVAQTANLAGFVAGCFGDDRALIGRSLQDLIVEPQRAHLIPGFSEVKKAALAAGALGCSIAGAGPSVFALHDFDVDGAEVAKAMVDAFAAVDVEAEKYLSPINGLGAHIVDRGPVA